VSSRWVVKDKAGRELDERLFELEEKVKGEED
jgi:uncharacterized lipoprotein YmbA